MAKQEDRARTKVYPELEKLEPEQAISAYRAQYAQFVQMTTVLIVANVTIIAYAATTKIAGILFIGAIFPILMFYTHNRTNKMMLPMLYTAIGLENKYGKGSSDWLITTLLSYLI